MPSQTYRFNGLAMWAKVHEPDKKFNRYTVDAYLDDPSFRLFNSTGLQLEVRDGEVDGETKQYVKFSRPVSKIIKGKLVEYPPIPVFLNGEQITDLVGNGSECQFEVQVFDTIKGKGHSLEKVTVRNLIPYGGAVVEPDYDEPLRAEPEKDMKLKLAKSRTTSDRRPIDDDSIPF